MTKRGIYHLPVVFLALLALVVWNQSTTAVAAPPVSKPGAGVTLDPETEKIYQNVIKEAPSLTRELLAAAKKEGKLVIYHLVIPMPKQIEEFKKRFPFLKVETFQASGPPLFHKFTTEQRAGNYIADIWQHTDPGQTNEIVQEGLLAKYLPQTDANYPDALKNKEYWYPLGLSRILIAYNPNVLSKEDVAVLRRSGPDTAADPRWKGKVGLMQMIGGAGTLPIYYWYKEKGVNFMKKVYANQPLMFAGNAVAAERLAAGEYGVIFGALESTFYTIWKEGAPIEYIAPEPILALPFTQGIVKTAPHPNAARLWHEWFLSDGVQRLWMEVSGTPPTNKNVRDERDVTKQAWYKSGQELWKWDFAEMRRAEPEVRKAFNELTANLRKVK